jgi:NADPH:quinone reductase-like Zn-dependent oxidoreductase
MTFPATQRQWRLVRSGVHAAFIPTLAEASVPELGDRDVLVRIRAASLNRRDIHVLHGEHPPEPRNDLAPLSDGAGEVVAVGRRTTRFQVGDRVVAAFFQAWTAGRATPEAMMSALGGEIDGVLSEYVRFDEQGLVRIPSELTFEEAATLPCAGVTAFNGLFTRGHLASDDWVLLEGTGGVSILGLQLALAVGAKPIVTSSSDEKLERARRIGAVATVNYRDHPKWAGQVRELTGGIGVQQVLEVGGATTRREALACLGMGGQMALIGGLGGFGGELPADELSALNATASGVYVGSRSDLESLVGFIQRCHLKPLIDRVYRFLDLEAAYRDLESCSCFGKVAIQVP